MASNRGQQAKAAIARNIKRPIVLGPGYQWMASGDTGCETMSPGDVNDNPRAERANSRREHLRLSVQVTVCYSLITCTTGRLQP